MGRGAGNAPIEIITALFPTYNNTPYLEVITEHYKDLPTWGAQPNYVLSGIAKVHPYYANKVMDHCSFKEAKRLFMQNTSLPVSYNEGVIMKALKEFL
jgi:hypothetical protein